MINSHELEIQLVRKQKSKKALAKVLCISEMALSNEMKGKSEFKASEISRTATFLNLTRDERDLIFFAY